ncbi:MAG: carboxypeptidase-like regulatory domain-containing protein, partial [Bacteroidota bacterium]|nr:carboxypeptidase-like regulatory domain-containing protein [Bacteroidota bacterium]
MQKVLLFIIIVFFSIGAKSQVAIRGSVIDDKTKLPVAGATITLMPADIFTVTDAAGKFSLKENMIQALI